MKTDVELPKVSGTELPEGWCRFKRGGYDFIVATKTNEPLNVRFPLPNGRYELAFKMQGFAVIEVGNQSYEHNKGTSIEFGEITVTDEVFRATIRPRGDQTVVFSYFGFTPPAAVVKNPDEAREQLERLRALGYVD